MYFNLLRLYIGHNHNYLPEKFNDKAKKKIYIGSNFFYIRGKTSLVSQVFGKKREENPLV